MFGAVSRYSEHFPLSKLRKRAVKGIIWVFLRKLLFEKFCVNNDQKIDIDIETARVGWRE